MIIILSSFVIEYSKHSSELNISDVIKSVCDLYENMNDLDDIIRVYS